MTCRLSDENPILHWQSVLSKPIYLWQYSRREARFCELLVINKRQATTKNTISELGDVFSQHHKQYSPQTEADRVQRNRRDKTGFVGDPKKLSPSYDRLGTTTASALGVVIGSV